ncbi:hypothetical protein BH09BAC6_BH09BAC6_00440 [soil metagenome]
MKLLLIAFFTVFLYQTTKPTLSELRSCYQQAGIKKAAAEKLNQLTALVDSGSEPVLIGYKGANEMLQAKYILNPITKLSRFNKGKTLLQMAIKRDTTNLEIRFLRFSIQSNIPSFLNYNAEMIPDKQFLIANTPRSKDEGLKEMIVKYFIAANTLTNTELNNIKNE